MMRFFYWLLNQLKVKAGALASFLFRWSTGNAGTQRPLQVQPIQAQSQAVPGRALKLVEVLILIVMVYFAWRQTQIAQRSLDMLNIAQDTVSEMRHQTEIMKDALLVEKPAVKIETLVILDAPVELGADVSDEIKPVGIEIHLQKWYDVQDRVKLAIQVHNQGDRSMTSDSAKVTLTCRKGSTLPTPTDSVEVDFPIKAAKGDVSTEYIVTEDLKGLLDKMPSAGFKYVTVSIGKIAIIHGGIYGTQECLTNARYRVND